jgi:hypothetical protein
MGRILRRRRLKDRVQGRMVLRFWNHTLAHSCRVNALVPRLARRPCPAEELSLMEQTKEGDDW